MSAPTVQVTRQAAMGSVLFLGCGWGAQSMRHIIRTFMTEKAQLLHRIVMETRMLHRGVIHVAPVRGTVRKLLIEAASAKRRRDCGLDPVPRQDHRRRSSMVIAERGRRDSGVARCASRGDAVRHSGRSGRHGASHGAPRADRQLHGIDGMPWRMRRSAAEVGDGARSALIVT